MEIGSYNASKQNKQKNKGTILAKIILVIIIAGTIATPVMAYKPIGKLAEPWPPGYLPNQYLPQPPTLVFNFSSLPLEERKIAPDLLYLIYPDRIAMNVSSKDPVVNLQNAKINLQNAKLYRPGIVTIQDGMKIQATPDLVFLDIKLWPGNSTHILDPFIHELNGRAEDWGELSAWVEVSNIEKIARMPEVGRIDTVTYAIFNIGGHETEGNSTLHAKEVIELPNTPDGEGMRVGVISDGVHNILDAIGWVYSLQT